MLGFQPDLSYLGFYSIPIDILFLIIVLLIHEGGHSLFAKFYKIKTTMFGIGWLGAFVNINRKKINTKTKAFLIYGGGFIPGIVIGLIILFALSIGTFGFLIYNLLYWYAVISILTNFFNGIPLSKSLDSFQMFKKIIGFKSTLKLSLITSFLLMILTFVLINLYYASLVALTILTIKYFEGRFRKLEKSITKAKSGNNFKYGFYMYKC